MNRRKSLEIEGVTHGKTPIPQGAKIGPFVFSSAIAGVDPSTGTIPEDPRQQVQLVFQHVRRFMEGAGGTPEDIGRMTVYLENEELRNLVNEEWVKMFPDPQSRPARHSTVTHLRNGAVVQVEMIAVVPE
ncbi:RidA family protein [Alicyclobacillus fastidiosus]|uniref:RidA family protein n=1 Tax=Alicyclobacillus fastidiosus TaxID=392011 RepID=A0ABV5AAF6_9BACL|nr:RidA family protein [Alicyclobacillus fastidiosus]WEH07605.1 RidA family protein [Alicyclobacillus fastidiosus]